MWYLQNGRSLPWRETKDPYRIWLSEIILQQTRVAQGLPYYLKFIEAFPKVQDLAEAPEEKVLKLWQGLGYYSRARNLHYTAKYIVDQLDGIFPNTYKTLLQLKGVGDYTASAIASICFDQPTAVVDGNVYRVLSRVFGIKTPINSSPGMKEFKNLAQLLIDPKQPGTYNQAIMEFGAQHCLPQNPKCTGCIFSARCKALATGEVNSLPVKLKKTKIKKHHFNYIIPVSKDEKTLLEQRTGKGIWENLYQFPLVESSSEVDTQGLLTLDDYRTLSKRLDISSVVAYNEEPIVHKLSHKHLYTRFWIAEVSELKEEGIPYHKAQQYPVPVLLGNFISEFSLFQD
jgi:A/G-specific adenine glycosylase